ncbi:MAG: ATP-dependent helicase [Synechococcales cyanobacterium CRU_2_2]|nr:ATP-dependent helicase [Synechococcales cyanobacterium CRU_2_2]
MSISPSSAPTVFERSSAKLAADLVAIRDRLRSGQQHLADWQGGELAVSAVPGAGKSTGMAGAAAIAIAKHRLNLRCQLVLVTFTRSAAANLKTRIRQLLRELKLPANGFSVHTLHGLALAIAHRHPELSGLNFEDSALITPARNHRLMRDCVDQWIADFPKPYEALIQGRGFDGEETERLRRRAVLRTEVLPDLANTVIHEAKSSGILPEALRSLAATACLANPSDASDSDLGYNVLEIAAGLYERYQTLLSQRGLMDYDDMILAALRVLAEPATRALWQRQTFAVFEDEAQDSTPLQTRLLEILGQDPDHPEAPPNLVRVGDPNQAINSTFTPADPIFFRQFCDRCQAQNRLITLDRAGRSSPVILDAANFVLDWVNRNAYLQGRRAPFRSQHIQPVPQGDPQPNANPSPLGAGLELCFPETTFATVECIRAKAIALFAQDPQTQAAILVRENKQGRFLAQRLEDLETEHGIVVYEVGGRDRRSNVPNEILTLLQFIQRPHSPDNLKAALTTLLRRQLIPSQDLNALAPAPEQFLYPGPLDPAQSRPVREARRYCNGLLQARLALPPLQLLSFLALTLNYDPAELASADKLAEQAARRAGGEISLQTIIAALSEIVSSEKFEGIDLENAESRYTQPGQITIITMHKAKGLDWDVVFLPFLQAQTIPGHTWVPPQSKFLGEFTLSEVARAQIRTHLHQGPDTIPDLNQAWAEAGALKQAEEFRLLYVAMTRAKRLLWMAAARQAPFSWNKPEGIDPKLPCPAFTALAQRFPQAVINTLGESTTTGLELNIRDAVAAPNADEDTLDF